MNNKRSPSATELFGSSAGWFAIIEETRKLVQLPANWDGEGADPIPPVIINSALALFERLKQAGQPFPDAVYPLPSGSLIAEWHNEDRTRFTAEIREPGRVELMHWFPDRPARFSTEQIPESGSSAGVPTPPVEEASGGSNFQLAA